MIETLTLITLSILLLIYFRPGKIPPLDSPLVINRTGRYQAILAPQLNLAQPFIEAIAEQLAATNGELPDSTAQFFEVYDKQVLARGQKFYLLAISRREGMLYFQASNPKLYTQDKYSVATDQRIVAAVQEAALRRGITVQQIVQ